MGRLQLILLDTCVWWWMLNEPHKLSRPATLLIEQAARNDIYISSISFWEFSLMVTRSRIELNIPSRQWMNRSIDEHRIQALPLTPEIALDSCRLEPFHKDPADRIITATARHYGCSLITSDQKIRDFEGVNTVW